MSKTKVIRTTAYMTMYRKVERRRGRGANFQWNAQNQYLLVSNHPGKPLITNHFKTFEEADREWVYLTLRYG